MMEYRFQGTNLKNRKKGVSVIASSSKYEQYSDYAAELDDGISAMISKYPRANCLFVGISFKEKIG